MWFDCFPTHSVIVIKTNELLVYFGGHYPENKVIKGHQFFFFFFYFFKINVKETIYSFEIKLLYFIHGMELDSFFVFFFNKMELDSCCQFLSYLFFIYKIHTYTTLRNQQVGYLKQFNNNMIWVHMFRCNVLTFLFAQFFHPSFPTHPLVLVQRNKSGLKFY